MRTVILLLGFLPTIVAASNLPADRNNTYQIVWPNKDAEARYDANKALLTTILSAYKWYRAGAEPCLAVTPQHLTILVDEKFDALAKLSNTLPQHVHRKVLMHVRRGKQTRKCPIPTFHKTVVQHNKNNLTCAGPSYIQHSVAISLPLSSATCVPLQSWPAYSLTSVPKSKELFLYQLCLHGTVTTKNKRSLVIAADNLSHIISYLNPLAIYYMQLHPAYRKQLYQIAQAYALSN
jgi:hypothetical protein